jgi:hypothetical protein
MQQSDQTARTSPDVPTVQDIRPRISKNGDRLCSMDCPRATPTGDAWDRPCEIDGKHRYHAEGHIQMSRQEPHVCPHHVRRMAALLRRWGALAPEEGAWWCPACGETDCRHNGSCGICGLPIEDSQPDFDLISSTRTLLGDTNKSAEQGGE